MMTCPRCTLALLMFCGITYCQSTEIEEKSEVVSTKKVRLVTITLAQGNIELKVPETWKKHNPRSPIIELEFAIPAATGDKQAGRLTMLQSGGSVTQNIQRWYGQFAQPDKKATKDVAKVEKKKINDQDIVIVDISGTFNDRQGGGPFAPGKIVERRDYRMLGGIVQMKQRGQYFFKLYGPKKTIASSQKSFMGMMESITSK